MTPHFSTEQLADEKMGTEKLRDLPKLTAGCWQLKWVSCPGIILLSRLPFQACCPGQSGICRIWEQGTLKFTCCYLLKKGDRLRIESSVAQSVCTSMRTQVQIPSIQTRVKVSGASLEPWHTVGMRWGGWPASVATNTTLFSNRLCLQTKGTGE